MSTIAEQLQELAQIKEAIRQAIIAKGVTVASDAAFSTYATAIGQISGGGSGGSDFGAVLDRSIVTLTTPSGITKIGQYAFAYCPLTSLEVSSGITLIEGYACQACTVLQEVDLPSSLTQINASAFSSCFKLDTIICRATTPPTANNSSFGNTANNFAGKNATGAKTLYVPYGCSSAYQSATGGWATLLSSTGCNFTIAELNVNGQIPDPNS